MSFNFGSKWNTVYRILSGNVSDPSSRGSKWMFSDFPDIKEGDEDEFPGYPIITIDFFQPSTSNVVGGVGGTTINEITTNIAIHTNTASQQDTISSEVWSAINTNRGILAASGMRKILLSPGGTDVFNITPNKKIHTQNIGFECTVDS